MENIQFEFRDERSLYLIIGHQRLYYQYTTSDNRRFLLAFHDGCHSLGISGFKNKGLGTYFLFDDKKLVLNGELERPNDGKVSDNGNFVFNDWLFTEKTKSQGAIFDVVNSKFTRISFSANLFNNCISSSGKFAAFVTCNSRTSDASCLFLVDIDNGQVILKKKISFDKLKNVSIEDFVKINLKYAITKEVIYWPSKGADNNAS